MIIENKFKIFKFKEIIKFKNYVYLEKKLLQLKKCKKNY